MQGEVAAVRAALVTMKANHTRVLAQLDDTHKRLNQERKVGQCSLTASNQR